MDKALRGSRARRATSSRLDGRVIPTGHQHSTPAVPGRDVRLTINTDLQWFAQNAISAQGQGDRGAVRDGRRAPTSGPVQLLAVASYPTFDPNHLARATGNLDNRAFDEVYEPGSTARS